MQTKAVSKYLQQYAEPEYQLSRQLPEIQQDYALIIPAYNEPPAFLQHLQQLLKHNRALVILVINQPDLLPTATDANLKLAKHIADSYQPLATHKNLALYQLPDCSSQLLVVDRFSNKQQIPIKQGVGLARKIAADIAVGLVHSNQVLCPLVFSTDCDARLPEDYFARGEAAINAGIMGACLFPFRHLNDHSPEAAATLLYEFSLNYYCAGLNYAGSPYAFHTIGSTLAVSASAYCQTRGFPKKSAGEDFYLLNKIAKVAKVISLSGDPIEILPRLSERVPFGTGPASRQILQQQQNGEPITIYHPHIFHHLQQLLTQLPELQQNSVENVLERLEQSSRRVLTEMGIEGAVKHAKKQSQQLDSEQFLRQMHTWFDGFKTLKYVHGMRNQGFNNIPLAELADSGYKWVEEVPGYRPALDSAI